MRCNYFFLFLPTGEETKNPKRDIPMAIVASLFLSTIAYCGVATVLTLMWPYYSQVHTFDTFSYSDVKKISSTNGLCAVRTLSPSPPPHQRLFTIFFWIKFGTCVIDLNFFVLIKKKKQLRKSIIICHVCVCVYGEGLRKQFFSPHIENRFSGRTEFKRIQINYVLKYLHNR